MVSGVVEIVLEEYGLLSKTASINPIHSGLTNFNYEIIDTQNKKYFLKIFRQSNRVGDIAALIHNLMEYRFPTPALIPCQNGQLFWTDGRQGAIMTEFIEGKFPQAKEDEFWKIGHLMGALHTVPVNTQLLKGYSLDFESQVSEIKNLAADDDIQAFIEGVRPFIETIPDGDFPESIVHGDVFLDNLLVTEFGDIYFIDFEGGCVDRCIFDLARSIIGCTIRNQVLDLHLTHYLLSGYEYSRPLEEIEKEYLFEYVIYAGAVSTLWRYLEFNHRRSGENKTGLYKELLNPTWDFLRKGKKEFVRKALQKSVE